MIAATVCVVIDDGGDQSRQAVACQNPLDDLIERLRREMQHGRDSTTWRIVDGSKVA